MNVNLDCFSRHVSLVIRLIYNINEISDYLSTDITHIDIIINLINDKIKVLKY